MTLVLQIRTPVNMLICMKPTSDEIASLARRIDTARRERGWSYAELARRSGMHPSQTSRICAGEFRTFGANVVRICTALGIGVEGDDGASTDPVWDDLQRAVQSYWDGTPGGAAAITALIRAAFSLHPPR